MVLTRALPSIQRCSNCQSRLLHTFASLAGLSLRATSGTLPISRQLQYAALPRNFSTAQSRFLELVQQEDDRSNDEASTLDVPEEDLHSSSTVLAPDSDSGIPWYLQVQPPPSTISPLSDRQRLPELPENPPALLLLILENLSNEVGLDDLTLLDIRKLDPPPALGANLIMLLGTARSEKHLHISADRFCRWLRTVHKLSPYADGLLGRNELKLKIRRKARRAKLLGSVGSTDKGNTDDGIRTGWVCVNIGSIEVDKGSGEVVDYSERADGFVGFGGESDGVKLVVQMLTEEKREELDLETLWGGFLSRQQRKEVREAEKQIEEAKEREVGHSFADARYQSTDIDLSMPYSLRSPTRISLSHNRTFHTNARSMNALNHDEPTSEYDGLDEGSLEPRLNPPELTAAEFTSNAIETSTSFDRSANELVLAAHMRYLKRLQRENAIEVLGTGAADFNSTTFLNSFYKELPLFLESSHWQHRLELVRYALDLDHPGYSAKDLFDLIRSMQESGESVPRAVYQHAVTVLAEPMKNVSRSEQGRLIVPMTNFLMCLDLISDMSLQSQDIFEESTISVLLRALPRVDPTCTRDRRKLRADAIFQLMRLLDERYIYLSRSSSHYYIMNALADAGDWKSFWKYWHGIARRLQRKSFILYASMFRIVSRTDHQADCVAALRDWIPEMEIEQPPVPLTGTLARTVMDCLRVADPDVENQVHRGLNGKGQWVRLWRRCLQGAASSDEISKEEKNDELLEHFNAN
ncbi:ATPase synthesis protein 25 mitochondrial [Xylographa carneopallida]|nr:ATPase synthesis protein 25 mitochondrial [Xylographa carneopallida]